MGQPVGACFAGKQRRTKGHEIMILHTLPLTDSQVAYWAERTSAMHASPETPKTRYVVTDGKGKRVPFDVLADALALWETNTMQHVYEWNVPDSHTVGYTQIR